MAKVNVTRLGEFDEFAAVRSRRNRQEASQQMGSSAGSLRESKKSFKGPDTTKPIDRGGLKWFVMMMARKDQFLPNEGCL